MIKLSILIPSLPKRVDTMIDLYRRLVPQLTREVEVLIDAGEATNASAKRNSLLLAARGEYVVGIDDDDLVPPYYVSRILEAIKTGPDCVGFWVQCCFADRMRAKHSHSVEAWTTAPEAYYRTISFLNPVKRVIALQVPFDESKDFAEDIDHAMRLKPLLKSEVFIDKIMYEYHPQNGRVV